jgi:hypothetical protein
MNPDPVQPLILALEECSPDELTLFTNMLATINMELAAEKAQNVDFN